MNRRLESLVLTIETACQEVRKDQALPKKYYPAPSAKALTQTEAMLMHGDYPELPFVLLAPDGSSIPVHIRERIDTSTPELRSTELRLITTGAPQPAKGDV